MKYKSLVTKLFEIHEGHVKLHFHVAYRPDSCHLSAFSRGYHLVEILQLRHVPQEVTQKSRKPRCGQRLENADGPLVAKITTQVTILAA